MKNDFAMYNEKRILGFIPARGGSKGLPGKNILPLAGKPLVAWTLKAAQGSRFLDRTIVSTDDEAIARVAREHEGDVPFLRPAALATDGAATIDAVLHALDWLKEHGEQYDYLALLEPTSPLRKKDDIDRGIQMLLDSPEHDGIVSLGLVHMEHPRIVKKIVDGRVMPYTDLPGFSQRQQADAAYFPYGVMYLSRVASLYQKKTFYPERLLGLLIERWQNYEIDDAIDLEIAEILMRQYQPLR